MTNKYKKFSVAGLLTLSVLLLVVIVLNEYRDSANSGIRQFCESSNNSVKANDNVIDEDIVNLEDEWSEKYRGNSLSNGAQPYRALYGKNKQFGTSRIKITASDDQDVLIMVKDNRNKVVRHAYICKGKSYTFRIPAGTYQVFFVSGDSWCPEKEAPNGEKGFFLDSSTSKGDKEFIDEYYTLSYTLQPLFYGNFSPQKTDDIEAF